MQSFYIKTCAKSFGSHRATASGLEVCLAQLKKKKIQRAINRPRESLARFHFSFLYLFIYFIPRPWYSWPGSRALSSSDQQQHFTANRRSVPRVSACLHGLYDQQNKKKKIKSRPERKSFDPFIYLFFFLQVCSLTWICWMWCGVCAAGAQTISTSGIMHIITRLWWLSVQSRSDLHEYTPLHLYC